MVAVTLLSELQNGQENATSSFGLTFLGGGFDDFLFPMAHTATEAQDLNALRRGRLLDRGKVAKRYAQGVCNVNFSCFPTILRTGARGGREQVSISSCLSNMLQLSSMNLRAWSRCPGPGQPLGP